MANESFYSNGCWYESINSPSNPSTPQHQNDSTVSIEIDDVEIMAEPTIEKLNNLLKSEQEYQLTSDIRPHWLDSYKQHQNDSTVSIEIDDVEIMAEPTIEKLNNLLKSEQEYLDSYKNRAVNCSNVGITRSLENPTSASEIPLLLSPYLTPQSDAIQNDKIQNDKRELCNMIYNEVDESDSGLNKFFSRFLSMYRLFLSL